MKTKGLGVQRRRRVDHRRSVRSPLLVLEVKGKHYNKIFVGYTENVSKDGLFFSAKESLKAGDKFPVEFVLPDNVTKLTCTCEVIWTKQFGSSTGSTAGVGVRFVDLDEANKKIIDDWIVRAEKQQQE
jgi:uncharacterized protein (TIGR02266 family)